MMTPERRTSRDRRLRPTPMVSRYTLFGGRRRVLRRQDDPGAIYVDRLGQGIGILLLLTFFFHCLDAMFTLAHVANGGRELNPFMDYFLRQGSMSFLVVKLGMAGLGLAFLGLHKNFPLVRAGIAFLFTLYAGVVGYHFFLIFGA